LLVTAKEGRYVKISPSVPGSAQFFGKNTNNDGTISLMVHGGKWLTALPSGEIIADGTKSRHGRLSHQREERMGP